MCLLCIASCEYVASSFGVRALSSTVVTPAGAGDARVGSFVRGGTGTHGSSTGTHGSSSSSSSSLSIANSGLHDGGGKRLLAAQALADLEKVQPVAEPAVEDELKLAGARDKESDFSRAAPLPPPPQLGGGDPEGSRSKLPSIQDGEWGTEWGAGRRGCGGEWPWRFGLVAVLASVGVGFCVSAGRSWSMLNIGRENVALVSCTAISCPTCTLCPRVCFSRTYEYYGSTL